MKCGHLTVKGGKCKIELVGGKCRVHSVKKSKSPAKVPSKQRMTLPPKPQTETRFDNFVETKYLKDHPRAKKERTTKFQEKTLIHWLIDLSHRSEGVFPIDEDVDKLDTVKVYVSQYVDDAITLEKLKKLLIDLDFFNPKLWPSFKSRASA